MTSLSSLTVDELAAGICVRAGRIAAGEAELLVWVAEFDRREGWAGPGMLSCAHWLSWRVGLSPGAAREQVRVARRLPDLPELAAAFAEGRVSYSKVRAITRAAEPDDGVDWVELARHSSASQLETLVRGMRRAQFNELAEKDPEAAAWPLRTRMRYDEHGNFSMTISGPAQFGPVVQAVCSRHHTLIHAQGFELLLHPDRRLEVHTAEGVSVVHHPAQPWGDPAALAQGCGQRVSDAPIDVKQRRAGAAAA